MKSIVINLIGGPGTGKSTISSDLFAKFKHKGIDTELSLEFAKDLVYEGRHETFKDELYIFAKQAHQLFRLDGKVKFIITDRPLIMSKIYNEYYSKDANTKEWNEHFNSLVLDTYNRYDNVTIFLKRIKAYNPNGRNETEEQAKNFDKLFRKSLGDDKIPFFEIEADEFAADKIIKYIEETRNIKI